MLYDHHSCYLYRPGVWVSKDNFPLFHLKKLQNFYIHNLMVSHSIINFKQTHA